MDILLLIGILILLALLAVALLLYKLLSNKSGNADSNEMLLLQNQLRDLNHSLSDRLKENTSQLQKNSDSMQRSVAGQLKSSQELLDRMSNQLQTVQKGLAQNNESTKQVLGITETLQSLERTLRNQKQRGELGEAGLRLIEKCVSRDEINIRIEHK